MKKRLCFTALSILLLTIEFLFCRFVMFDLHGMKEFPFVLFLDGLFVIIISAVFNSTKTMLCTVVGYIAGFVLAALFNKDWIAMYGARMNNFWLWFMGGMAAFILIGVIWDVVSRIYKRAREKNNGAVNDVNKN